jgi:hypothetical protein
MKKWISFALIVAALTTGQAVSAQTVDKAKHGVKNGAVKAGNKTAEVASKGKSKVTDKTDKTHTGPNGETIYIASDGRYYWKDKKGKRHYIAAAALKTKI